MTTSTITRPEIDTGVWTFDKAHTEFGFVAKHLMVSKVRGRFEQYDGTVEIAEDLTDSKVEVSLDAAAITTGNTERDNHLRSGDFLDAETYPRLRFESTEIVADEEGWKVTGDLTIREVTAQITFNVVYLGSATDPWGNEHIAFEASATMVREDWDLTWNVPLESGGWLVSKEVHLPIEGQLIRPQ